jgi:hypothetical protein
MKDIRSVIGEFINNKFNKRENKIMELYEQYCKEVTPEELKELNQAFWLNLRFGVEEYAHADMEIMALNISDKKVKISGREDLRSWWFYKVYLFQILKWKIFNFV